MRKMTRKKIAVTGGALAASWMAAAPAQAGSDPPAAEPTRTSIQRGDVNRDGRVDVHDLIAVVTNLGRSGDDVTGDVTGDGYVDPDDLFAFMPLWTEAVVRDSAGGVPSKKATRKKASKKKAVRKKATRKKASRR